MGNNKSNFRVFVILDYKIQPSWSIRTFMVTQGVNCEWFWLGLPRQIAGLRFIPQDGVSQILLKWHGTPWYDASPGNGTMGYIVVCYLLSPLYRANSSHAHPWNLPNTPTTRITRLIQPIHIWYKSFFHHP